MGNNDRQKQRSYLFDLGYIRQKGGWLNELKEFAGMDGKWIDLSKMDAVIRAQIADGTAYVDAFNRKVEENQAEFIRLDTGIIVSKDKTGDSDRLLIIKFHRSIHDNRWVGLDFEYGDVAEFSSRNLESLQEQQAEIPSFRNLGVDGKKFRYEQFAFNNLAVALKNIGKLRDQNKNEMFFQQIERRFLCPSFDALSDAEKRADEIILETGCTLRPDIFDEEYGNWARVQLLLKRTEQQDFTHDIYFVIDGDRKGKKTIKDCIPDLYQMVDRIAVKKALQDLAEKADEENWSWKDDPFGSLRYYLESVFSQLQKDEQEMSKCKNGVQWPIFTHPKECPEATMFCTGLVTRVGNNFIHAICSNPDRTGLYKSIRWISHERDSFGNRIVNPALENVDGRNFRHHGVPLPPNWVGCPDRLLFNYRYGSISENQIGFLYPHIYYNLQTRLPSGAKQFFTSVFSQNVEWNHLSDEKQDSFREFIHQAWRNTRKLLQKSFKIAIPTYYRNEIQLLVPLYLDPDNPDVASVALVVTLNRDLNNPSPEQPYHYYCPTCLDLDMARRDSRVITRIDGTWLSRNTNDIRGR